MSPTVTLRNVTATHPGGSGISAITLTLPPGSTTVVAGGNGAGKSTLLSVLAGSLPVHSGSITGLSALHAATQVALVPQHSTVPKGLPLTVTGLVSMGRWATLGPWRRPCRSDHNAVADALAAVNISDLANRDIDSLSGGQRQRALVARALCQQPSLLLLDEPTSSLDAHSRDLIMEAITTLSQAGVTIVHTTHDPLIIGTAQRLITLADGRILTLVEHSDRVS
ncbi:MAG: metal ABC transporter ATP-binding protein [Mycetocola sp.]